MYRNFKVTYDHLINLSLQEDIGTGDITTRATVPKGLTATAQIKAKQDMVVAGVDVAARVFKTVDKKIKIEIRFKDGRWARKGAVIARLRGPARGLLTAERTALNFLQHLSGIATLTHKFVEKTRGAGVKILDTRKTTPGWRELEKYAVRMGGGHNHRMGLWDRYLVKSSHVEIVGSVGEAVVKCKKQEAGSRKQEAGKIPPFPPFPPPPEADAPLEQKGAADQPLAEEKGGEGGLEVEARNLQEVAEALACGADIIMLDNFTVAVVRKAVRLVSSKRGGIKRPKLEVSGSITLKNVKRYAKTGVDYISVGAITHSAPAADINMQIGVRPLRR